MRFVIDIESTNPEPEKVRKVLERELGFAFGSTKFEVDMVDDDHEIVIRKQRFEGDRE